METLSQKVDHDIFPKNEDVFHEYLRAYTNLFISNVKNRKDYMYKLKGIIDVNNIVVLCGDKDSCVVLMQKYH